MKTAFLNYVRTLMTFAIVAFAITSCGKKGDDNNQPPMVCPMGVGYQTEAGCFDNNGLPIGQYQNLDLSYLTANFQIPNTNVGPLLRISNGGAYQAFLREAMGVCNRGQTNFGISNCSAWLAGFIQIMFQAPLDPTSGNPNVAAGVSNANITIWAYPRTQQNYWYGGQLPKIGDFFKGLIGMPVISNVGAYRNPLPLGLTVSLINQSKGFEGRGYGAFDSTANIGLIQMQVMNGKLGDNNMNFKLFYKNQEFASGTFKRCIQSTCNIHQY
ncbi:MAG: hypothetical protein V4736_01370 [Bdellovibrionota bacterium]